MLHLQKHLNIYIYAYRYIYIYFFIHLCTYIFNICMCVDMYVYVYTSVLRFGFGLPDVAPPRLRIDFLGEARQQQVRKGYYWVAVEELTLSYHIHLN